jgi:hypothetical protein|tara:strand:- start:1662 stop:1994 length:333 start_codon:yes stop_codon:yes gene_type:complete
MNINFIETYLTDVTYPTKEQQEKELWDVSGIIKNKSNQVFKFDTRNLSSFKEGVGKKSHLKTKADKMVFKIKDKYLLIDLEELHNYIKDNNLKMINIKEIISKLDWNIVL